MSDAGHADPGEHNGHSSPNGATRLDPEHTAARLIAAAERLFAQGGEEATSLRAITREARSNAAAVHYHFGGRDELLRALVDQHLGPLAQQRARLVSRAIADRGEPAPVTALVEAMVRPDLELLAALRAAGRIQVARFLGRAQTLPTPALARAAEARLDHLANLMLPLLRQSLPDVSQDELRWRLRLIEASVAYVFAVAGPDPDGEVDAQVHRLAAFAADGLSAPGTAVRPTTAAPVAPAADRERSVARKAAPAKRATGETVAKGAVVKGTVAKGSRGKVDRAEKSDKKRRKR